MVLIHGYSRVVQKLLQSAGECPPLSRPVPCNFLSITRTHSARCPLVDVRIRPRLTCACACSAVERGQRFSVFTTEGSTARPADGAADGCSEGYKNARVLLAQGVPVTVVVDSAIAYVMVCNRTRPLHSTPLHMSFTFVRTRLAPAHLRTLMPGCARGSPSHCCDCARWLQGLRDGHGRERFICKPAGGCVYSRSDNTTQAVVCRPDNTGGLFSCAPSWMGGCCRSALIMFSWVPKA